MERQKWSKLVSRSTKILLVFGKNLVWPPTHQRTWCWDQVLTHPWLICSCNIVWLYGYLCSTVKMLVFLCSCLYLCFAQDNFQLHCIGYNRSPINISTRGMARVSKLSFLSIFTSLIQVDLKLELVDQKMLPSILHAQLYLQCKVKIRMTYFSLPS